MPIKKKDRFHALIGMKVVIFGYSWLKNKRELVEYHDDDRVDSKVDLAMGNFVAGCWNPSLLSLIIDVLYGMK